ncbi:MAG: class I SAM-dependent methyltransferase [Acidimicrobiia bacterium]|nr:class I SAM-dependent methyltransferase [Acidimicrobiia bacterium]
MLTVDYRRLDLEPGHLLLDMGAGAGRHAFESYRRGARVIALDYDAAELKDVAGLFAAMDAAGDVPPEAAAAVINGDGTRLPFPDESFDRIVCSEVLEHIPDLDTAVAELHRVLKPGGTMAVTVPTWFPEKICWALSEEYHAPFVPGGHIRIFTESALRSTLRAGGFEPGAAHHAHALHSPYWWLKCAVGPTNDTHPAVRAYHRLLVWDISSAPKATRWTEKVLNPVLGKSLVVYAQKPLRTEVESRRSAKEVVAP